MIPIETVDRIFQLADAQFKEQREFATQIGIAPSVISAWRNQKSKSYQKYLPQIAEVLGTTPEYLLTGKDPVPTNASDLSPEDRHILQQIHDRPGMRIMFDLNAKASDDDVARAVDIIKAYYGIREDQP